MKILAIFLVSVTRRSRLQQGDEEMMQTFINILQWPVVVVIGAGKNRMSFYNTWMAVIGVRPPDRTR